MKRLLLVLAAVSLGAGTSFAATGQHVHAASALPGLGVVAACLFGLLGSTHCAGMCGPLVAMYASQVSASAAPVHRQHLLFNLGRVLAYTNGGILCGAAGFVLATRPWIAAVVGMSVGLFVLTVAGRLVGISASSGAARPRLIPLAALEARMYRGCLRAARSPNIALLGALHALLPCPLLYVMYASAVALGDPARGGILLLAFGMGTVPMLWAIGAIGAALKLERRVRWHRLFGWTVAAWGVVLLIRSVQSLRAL
ncbi:MAG: sulfite exporter TauE/SafE family protein [Acidobacteria bacterium]|nr:sulfite exporter TauE/SafE family protein [Acidobacteriota bacterium]